MPLFAYDSITVSSTWELTSVSMRYSQGEGVNTFLSRVMYCTYDKYEYIVLVLFSMVVPFLCGVYGYLPWHGHVLPGMQAIKIICVYHLYQQG